MEWRDISSAPKDGTLVQLYRYVEPWHVIGYGYWTDVRGFGGWLSYGYSASPGNLGLAAPTHWQPLPPPPAPEAGDVSPDVGASGREGT